MGDESKMAMRSAATLLVSPSNDTFFLSQGLADGDISPADYAKLRPKIVGHGNIVDTLFIPLFEFLPSLLHRKRK